MSGGSWDYFYRRLDEVASRLCDEESPLRVLMGKKLKKAAIALHDIEWVDSSDCAEGDDEKAIRNFLKENS